MIAGNFEEPGADDEDGQDAAPAKEHEPVKPTVQVDDQLSKGLELLKGKTT